MKVVAFLVLVLASVPMPAVEDDPAKLVVSEADDKLGGKHELSLVSLTIDGEIWRAGCVPCFSTFTMLAIGRKQAYALNGYGIKRLKRFAVSYGSNRTSVLEWNSDLPTGLLHAASTAPGCEQNFGSRSIIDAMGDALTIGKCIGTR